jgi:hypothetical protein
MPHLYETLLYIIKFSVKNTAVVDAYVRAAYLGMCFGVRRAIALALAYADTGRLTIVCEDGSQSRGAERQSKWWD